METTNWRCPTCETVNTGDFCTVCGCKKPVINTPGSMQQSVNQNINFGQPSYGGQNMGQPQGFTPNSSMYGGNPAPSAPNPAVYGGNPAVYSGNPAATPTPAASGTGMTSGKKAWKIISVILLYIISIVLILWVSIMVGTILLAISVGYNVRVVNGFKNEKARLESERRKRDAMR